MKTITIANAHSIHQPDKKIELKLEGGSPYFCYLWIDDVLYSLIKTERSVKLSKVK